MEKNQIRIKAWAGGTQIDIRTYNLGGRNLLKAIKDRKFGETIYIDGCGRLWNNKIESIINDMYDTKINNAMAFIAVNVK